MRKSIILTSLMITVALCSITAVVGATALPEIKILATGGTIAGAAVKTSVPGEYKADAINIQKLLAAVPQIKNIATVSGEQVVSIGSNNMTDAILLQLARRCNELLAQDKVSGIVITHGTDTLEETAYFLNLTVQSNKPVVLVGSMRPATLISADGPMNLLNAVRLAADTQSRGKGVLIAMNDSINDARETTKTSTYKVETFKAPELGALGYFVYGKVYFYREPLRRHTAKSEFAVSNLTILPRVDIIYTHVSDDRALIDAAVQAGAQGIVYAGSGMGSIHEHAEPGLVDAQKQGVVIVRSSRVGNGLVVADSEKYAANKFLNGDNLNPQKAGILLQLALTRTKDLAQIQRIFNEY